MGFFDKKDISKEERERQEIKRILEEYDIFTVEVVISDAGRFCQRISFWNDSHQFTLSYFEDIEQWQLLIVQIIQIDNSGVYVSLEDFLFYYTGIFLDKRDIYQRKYRGEFRWYVGE